MPEMVRLYGSVKEIWKGINGSYVHPVTDQITTIKKTDTYMPTLLTKLLQLYKEKKYQRNPSYKLHDILDQVNSKITAVKGGVLSGLQLINDENFYVCINGKKCGKKGNVLYKIIFDDKK